MKESKKSSKPIVFGHSHSGTAQGENANSERHFEGRLTTQGGLEMTLLVVSDGEGGMGAQAAQQTVQTIVEVCQASPQIQAVSKDILGMLGKAIGEANRRVYAQAQSNPAPQGMQATVVVAAIIAGRLYLANVGHSRAYLIRGSHVTQLTIDHSWARHWADRGELDWEQARRHPDAQHLTRAIGLAPGVQVDFGLYLQGGKEGGERAYQQQGLVLGANDVLLLCSDGLTRPLAGKRQDYVSREEIRNVIEGSTAEQAAKTLVDLAVGRNVVDNVTAVVAEMPGRTRQKQLAPGLKVGLAAAIGISILLLVIFGVVLFSVFRLAPSSTEPTQIPGYAYISSGSLLYLPPSGETTPLGAGDTLAFGEGSMIIVGGAETVLDLPGNYRLRVAGTVESQSRLELAQAGVTGQTSETRITLEEGSLFVVAAGGADTGILFSVETDLGKASISGPSTIGVRYRSGQMWLDCFSGSCLLKGKQGDDLLLTGGQRGQIGLDQVATAAGPVVPEDYPEYPVDFIQSLPIP